jgi:hypothetical protein
MKELDQPILVTLMDYITFNAEMERKFGPANALLRYGKLFEPKETVPAWVKHGEPKECFANATRALLSCIGVERNEVHYAEGYAIDRVGIPVPIQHAWLVDAARTVIDPTWTDSFDHLYFGISFSTSFVLEMLKRSNGVCGVFVNPSLMRSYYGTAELLEGVIWNSIEA